MAKPLPRRDRPAASAGWLVALMVGSPAAQESTSPATRGGETRPLAEQLRAVLAPASQPTDTELARLEGFLAQNASRPLGEFTYAQALLVHLRGGRTQAAMALDRYFAEHAELPIAEHGARVGRVYRDALATLSLRPRIDLGQVERWGQLALRHDPDATAVLRAASTALTRAEPAAEVVQVRMQLVRTLLQSSHTDQERDRALAALFAATPRTSAAGAPIEWRARTLGGKSIDLTDLRGRVVLLLGWTPWDPRCAADAPNVVATHLRYHTAGFDVVGVVPDAASEVSDLLAQAREFGFTFEQVRVDEHDPLFDRLGVEAGPFAVLLDQRGVPVAQGAQARGAELTAQVARLLGVLR